MIQHIGFLPVAIHMTRTLISSPILTAQVHVLMSSTELGLAAVQLRVRRINSSYPVSCGSCPNSTTQICATKTSDEDPSSQCKAGLIGRIGRPDRSRFAFPHLEMSPPYSRYALPSPFLTTWFHLAQSYLLWLVQGLHLTESGAGRPAYVVPSLSAPEYCTNMFYSNTLETTPGTCAVAMHI